MRLTMAIVVVAALAAGLALRAEDKKKEHKCPLETIMCPFKGDCEGECRKLCDRGGEALVAVHQKMAVSLKATTKKDASAHIAGTCKEADCKDCASLNDKVFGPVIKAHINTRMAAMGGKAVKHSVKDSSGKTSEMTCTFLTGKLCSACVDEMTNECLAKVAEMDKQTTK